MLKKNEGFSLIELIVVIAILAIMSAGAISGLGYLSMANASKCVSKIDSGIATLKSKNMREASDTYMHLYKYEGNYYIEYNNDPAYVPANADKGEMIANRQLTISWKNKDDASQTTIEEDAPKTFGIHKKDGSFKTISGTKEPMCEIFVKGKSTHKVTLVTDTGKHFKD